MKFIEPIKNNFGKKERNEALYQADFIAEIAPVGGIDFTDSRYIETGAGYEACLLVSGYPVSLLREWMSMVCSTGETVCVIDISTTDSNVIKKNLQKSMDEQTSRYATARSNADLLDAQRQYQQMEAMYYEIGNFDHAMKRVITRVYISGHTRYEVDTVLGEMTASLHGSGYRAQVCLNETKAEWRSVLLSYEQQQKDFFAKKGKEMTTAAVAGGRYFHFSQLLDPNGSYYGLTPTGGTVFLDLGHIDKKNNRTTYNFLVAGKSGMGKSTLLKKILLDRAKNGDLIRVFDAANEFSQLTEVCGGVVIALDGKSGNMINMLQILPADDLDVAYNKHIAKVSVIYQYLRKHNVDENELLVFKQLLRMLYVQSGIIDEQCNLVKDIKTMEPADFPTLSDLRTVTSTIIENIDQFEDQIMEAGQIRKSMMGWLENIELKLSDLCTTYGNIFDGHTTIQNFYDQNVVCFNVQALKDMEEEIYDAQLYNALSLCWDNALTNGTEMKNAWEKNQLDEKDIVHTYILIDEAHETINARKTAGVREVDSMMREGRKFFAGIGLASQHLRDFVPDGAGSDAVGQIKTMFSQTTYKFLMMHDSEVLPKLKEVYQDSFTSAERQRITQMPAHSTMLSAGSQKVEFDIWAEPVVLEVGSGGR